MIYSYLPVNMLLTKISILSKYEHKLLKNNKVLQENNNELNYFDVRLDKHPDLELDSLKYLLKIHTNVNYVVKNID